MAKTKAKSKAKTKHKVYDAADFMEFLRRRHPPSAWAFMEEVGDGTGMMHSRWADAVAYSLWPSRGLDLHGFEIKKSRGDWLRELKNPKKAEAVQSYCDYWWVVANHDVVNEGELPSAWGLMLPQSGTLAVKVKAPKFKAENLDRPMLASLFRRHSEAVDKLYRGKSKEYDRGWKAGITEGERRAKSEKEMKDHDISRRLRAIDEFEKVSGIKMNNWGMGNIGEVVKVLERYGLWYFLNPIKAAQKTMASMDQEAQRGIKAIEKIMKEKGK